MSSIYVKEIDRSTDIIGLIDLGRHMRDELQPDMVFDEPYIYLQAEAIINDIDRDRMNCWVAYDAGQLIGFFVGYCSPNVFSRERTASHEYWFVLKEYRKSRAAYLLMKAFEEWARLRGSTKIIVGVALDNTELAASVAMLFPRLGFKPAGSYFIKKTVKG